MSNIAIPGLIHLTRLCLGVRYLLLHGFNLGLESSRGTQKTAEGTAELEAGRATCTVSSGAISTSHPPCTCSPNFAHRVCRRSHTHHCHCPWRWGCHSLHRISSKLLLVSLMMCHVSADARRARYEPLPFPVAAGLPLPFKKSAGLPLLFPLPLPLPSTLGEP